MLRTLHRHLLLGLVALFMPLILVSAAQGQQEGAIMGEKATQRLTQDWHERLEKTEALLVRGEPKKALRQTKHLAREMMNRLHSGEAIRQYMGSVYVLRSVALAGMGREREAIWQWHVASQVFPKLRSYDLAKFGQPGQFLLDHPFEDHTAEGEAKEAFHASLKASFEGLGRDGLTRPRKIKAPNPDFPAGRRGAGTVSVLVASIIDVEGRPTFPRILNSKGEFTMVSAALDALMDWRFEPAKLDGEPVPSFYLLTVNFESGSVL